MRRAADLRGSSKRVEVEWIDSSSQSGWNSESDVLDKLSPGDSTLCLTLGYLIHEDDEKVTVAASLATDGRHNRLVGDAMTIPMVAVTEIRELRR